MKWKDSYFKLESERLRFRKLTEGDIPSWLEFFTDNPNLPYIGLDFSKSHEELAAEWVRMQFLRYEEHGLGNLAVIEKRSNLFIGIAGIIPREIEGSKEYEIAYSLKPTYWRKGYGTEIARHIREFGESHKIHHRFISIIHKENIGSIKVAHSNKMSIISEMIYLNMPVYVFATKNTDV